MDRTFELAERVRGLLLDLGHECAVIGATALAAWGYPRSTADVDIAVNVDPKVLSDLARLLTDEGLKTEVSLPDASDALGGTLTIMSDNSDPIQIVNFYNPHRNRNVLGRSLLEHANQKVLGELAVVDLPHLVATKLYAGGLQSRVDVVEVLRRNPDCDLGEIEALCLRLGLEAAWRSTAAELEADRN